MSAILTKTLAAVMAKQSVLLRSSPGMGLRPQLKEMLERAKVKALWCNVVTMDAADWYHALLEAPNVDVLILEDLTDLHAVTFDTIAESIPVIGLAGPNVRPVQRFSLCFDWRAPTVEEHIACMKG